MFRFLLFITIYLSFQFALSPSEGVDLASGRILILLLFFVWLAYSFKNKKVEIKNKLSTHLLVAFVFLNGFSLFFSTQVEWSVRKLLFFLSFLPIYFIGQDLLSSEKRKKKVIQFLVYGAALTSLLGIFQFFSQFVFGREKIYQFWADFVVVPFLGKAFSQAVLENPSWLVNVAGETYLRATAFFPDPHMLSFFLGLIFPLALGLIFEARKKIMTHILMALLILGANLLTFSRGGYLGLLAGAIFLLIIFWKNFSYRQRIGIFFTVLAIGIFILIPSPVNNRLRSSFDLQEGSNQGRIETWRKALEVIEKKPFFGVGLGNYPLEIKAAADYREPIYAHNTYLDIASETGIPNALVWIGFLFFTGLGLYKNKNKLMVFASVGVVIFSVHSLVETGIYSVAVLPALLIISSLNNE